MDKKLFEELIESLQQAVEHAEGKRSDLRTTTLPRPSKGQIKDRKTQKRKSKGTILPQKDSQ